MQCSRVIPKMSPILVHGKLVFHKNLGPKKAGGRCLTGPDNEPIPGTQPAHVGQELHVKSNQGDCLLK